MNIEEMKIADIQKGYRKKTFTVKEIITAYFDKIKNTHKNIGGFISLGEEKALQEAKVIDSKIQAGEEIGGLVGIPIALKDNISTKDLKTTCASRMLQDFVSPYDASMVTKLRDVGGIIIGKTNMEEFDMGYSVEDSYFPVTKNPWNFKKTAGTCGAAAVVAAGFSPLSFASDIDGSLRQSAGFCGVVGLKPTYGLVSRFGLFSSAGSLDQIGPMAKNVEDCAIGLAMIQGKDMRDGNSYKGNLAMDYIKELKKDVKGIKIGIPKEVFRNILDPEVSQGFDKSIRALEKIGVNLEEFSLPTMESGLLVNYIIASAEASSNLARYDGIRYGYRSKSFEGIDELMVNSRSEALGNEVKKRIMLGGLVLSSGYYDKYYKRATDLRNKIRADFVRGLEEYELILTPTSPILPFDIAGDKKDPLEVYRSKIYTVGANLTGLPAISIPCAFTSHNLPIGLQFIGNYYCENKLFNIAYNLERELDIDKKTPILKEVW